MKCNIASKSALFETAGQTLQYYRSQHEAKPRDAISLSASAVTLSIIRSC